MEITSHDYWESYLSKITSFTLREKLSFYNNSIIDLLSRFDSRFPTSLDIGPGWIPIIAELNNQISYIDSSYKVVQIKEKFGTLRYYIDFSLDKKNTIPFDIIHILISHAEVKSSSTCEQCGETAKLIVRPWYKTLCDTCASS